MAQVWAEAKVIWDSGKERLYLNKEEGKELAKRQRDYDMDNDLLGELQAFLEIRLPADWETYSKLERRAYIQARKSGAPYTRTEMAGGNIITVKVDGVCPRIEISAVEVLNEFFAEDNGRANIQTRKANNLLRKLDGWRESRERITLTGGYGRQKVFSKNLTNGMGEK